MRAAWLCCLLVALGCLGASAQQDHPLTDMPPPGLLQTAWMMPAFPDKRITAGRIVDVEVAMHNDAPHAYNMTIMAGACGGVCVGVRMWLHARWAVHGRVLWAHRVRSG